jgi:hypothetical protein
MSEHLYRLKGKVFNENKFEKAYLENQGLNELNFHFGGLVLELRLILQLPEMPQNLVTYLKLSGITTFLKYPYIRWFDY